MKTILIPTAFALACGMALAKLPAPDEATKAKAAETAARAAWQAKVDAFQLCRAQDKVAGQFRKTSTAAKPAAQPAPAQPAAAPAAAAPAAGASAPAPIAAVTTPAPIPPCADPGPFAYNPPEQKPLETSGAHSPTGTAATPPSVKPSSAEMAPAKKS